jgi:hypothetical protein
VKINVLTKIFLCVNRYAVTGWLSHKLVKFFS